MVSRRRMWGLIAGSVGVALSALLVAFGVYVPHLVRDRVSEVAARRGLTAEVGTVEPGFWSASLRDVRLRTGDGAVVVDIDQVSVDAGLWDLAHEGGAAVHEVDARGVRAVVDLRATDLAGTLARLRGGSAAGGPPGARARASIRMAEVAVTVRDRSGVLFAFEHGEFAFGADGGLAVTAGPLQLGGDGPDTIYVVSLALSARRVDDEWRLARAAFVAPDIRYREREATGQSPLLRRLRAARAAMPTDGTARDDETQVAERETAEQDPEGEAPSTAESIGEALSALRSRLAEGAEVTLRDLSVTAVSDAGEQRILRELEAEIASLARGGFRLEGSGRPGRGGRLGWNLTFDPDALRAEGDVDFQRVPFVVAVPFLPDLPWYRPEDARISGDLTIRGDGTAPVHIEGNVSVDDLGLSGRRIAAQAVSPVSFSMTGEADWRPVERRLDVERASFSIGEAVVNLHGFFEHPEDHYSASLVVSLPPTDCNQAVSAIPADLLAELAGFTFAGRIGGRLQMRVDSRDLDHTLLDIDVADGCTFMTAPAMADVTRFDSPFRHRVLEPDGSTFEMETGPGSLSWTPISQISPFLLHAVLGHEDAGFFRHSGFSTSAIRLALIRDLEEGRYAYGASTITMQLVKNVFLHREKTLARKIQEVLLTWWIESVMPKERILELYLNVIEYGPAIYGIRAAAEHYFGRRPSELGPAESAYLATILPNPKEFHAHWEADAIPEAHRRRVARFLTTLGSRGRYDAAAVQRGLSELDRLRFYRPGVPLPGAPGTGGHTAALPVVPADLDEQWEDALGPDDPNADDDEGFDETW